MASLLSLIWSRRREVSDLPDSGCFIAKAARPEVFLKVIEQAALAREDSRPSFKRIAHQARDEGIRQSYGP